jgi:hypothetical protein
MKTERQFLTLVAASFFVVLVWTGVHFYDQYTLSTVSSTLRQQIAPITPSFDLNTLRSVNARHAISPLYQANFSSSGAEAATTSAAITPVVSPPSSLGLPITGGNQVPGISSPVIGQPSASSAGGFLR